MRVPFTAADGQLDSPNTTVTLSSPYLLSHKYQIGLDDNVHIGNVKASFDQFQEPQDKDADFPEKYIDAGRELVKELEDLLLD